MVYTTTSEPQLHMGLPCAARAKQPSSGSVTSPLDKKKKKKKDIGVRVPLVPCPCLLQLSLRTSPIWPHTGAGLLQSSRGLKQLLSHAQPDAQGCQQSASIKSAEMPLFCHHRFANPPLQVNVISICSHSEGGHWELPELICKTFSNPSALPIFQSYAEALKVLAEEGPGGKSHCYENRETSLPSCYRLCSHNILTA